MEKQECIRYITITWFLFTGLGLLYANQSPRERVYQAFISDRMDTWDQVIGELRSRKATLSDTQLMELISYYYGYTGWAIGEGLNEKASRYIMEAENMINELVGKYPIRADLYAYRGAFLGYQIGIKPIKAPFLGPESMKNINYAIESDPNSLQGWIEKGNALFYMPKVFGGSKKKAKEAFEKAIQLMENDPELIHHNWLYLNVLMLLGQSCEKTGDLPLAKITYEKVLRIEPDFTYMRDKLYPSFMNRWGFQN
jgi:tetratricopeptide (TPR) repeat protein